MILQRLYTLKAKAFESIKDFVDLKTLFQDIDNVPIISEI